MATARSVGDVAVNDLLVILIALLFVFAVPSLLCWIGGVTAARAIRDRPIGVRATAEATRTGVQLGLLTPILFSAPALAAAGIICASVYWPGAAAWDDPPLRTAGLAAAAALAFACRAWYLPIFREEWQDLTRCVRERHWTPDRPSRVLSASRRFALERAQPPGRTGIIRPASTTRPNGRRR